MLVSLQFLVYHHVKFKIVQVCDCFRTIKKKELGFVSETQKEEFGVVGFMAVGCLHFYLVFIFPNRGYIHDPLFLLKESVEDRCRRAQLFFFFEKS